MAWRVSDQMRVRQHQHFRRSSNPVAPTERDRTPFGENVEGLSHCGDRSYTSTSVFNSQGAIQWSFE
jgi:hypothetical protein